MEEDLKVKIHEKIMELIMLASENKIIFVEGKTDKRFIEYHQFNFGEKYQVMTVESIQGKDNKDKVIQIIKQSKTCGLDVLGIVDKDYEHYENKVKKIENLIYYKEIDLERTLINSESIHKILNLISKDNSTYTEKNIEDLIFDKIKPLSIIKYINYKYEKAYNFNNINYKKIIVGVEENVILYLFQNANVTVEDREFFKTHYSKFKDNYIDLVKGHDILNLLTIFFNSSIVNTNIYNKLSESSLFSLLVSSYNVSGNISGDFFNYHNGNTFSDF